MEVVVGELFVVRAKNNGTVALQLPKECVLRVSSFGVLPTFASPAW